MCIEVTEEAFTLKQVGEARNMIVTMQLNAPSYYYPLLYNTLTDNRYGTGKVTS